jgi:RNase P/RNase MRP subunit p29
MKSTRFSGTIGAVLGGAALSVSLSLAAFGQVETTTKSAAVAEPTQTVKVERGTVVYVSGNSCVIKGEDGTLRHFDNVPDSVTVTVDGKQLNIHQIEPGMILERQTITTTTPKMITTIKTVTGRVWYVVPPNSVILTMENGKNQQFKIPKGQKFMVNGQETDAWGLKKGMKVDAQQIVEQPETVVAQEVKRTGVMPPPPPAPAPNVPILVLVVPAAQPAPVETAAAAPEPAPTALPKTASNVLLIGLLGMLFCGLSVASMALRGILSRRAS